MRLTHALALTLCLASTAPAVHADDASRRAKVEEMLQITKAGPALEEQIKNLQTRVNDLAKQQFGQGALSPEQTKLKDEYLQQVQSTVTDQIGWEKIRPSVVQIYMDSFTEPELDGIIAFYKTAPGQALITKTPDVLGKTNTTVTTRIKEMQPKLQELTQSYANKLKAAAPAPATPPAAPAAGASPAPSSSAPVTKSAPKP